MSKISNIYDNTVSYKIARFFVDCKVKNVYKRTVVVGLDKIPDKGSVILATNHCNALMDALNVLALNKEPKVFIARGDVFVNKTVNKFLRFAKILPIFRIRDGIKSVTKSEKTIKAAANVLAAGKKVHIFPEGAHRSKRNLLPIGKGIIRIALAANDLIKNDNVYILPIGLEYSDYFRYHTSLLIQVGDIINVTKYVNENADKLQYEVNTGLREEIRSKIADKIVYIDETDDYEAIWEIAKLLSGNIPERKTLKRFNKNKEIISDISNLKQNNPETADKIFRQADKLLAKRIKAKISIKSIACPKTKLAIIFNLLLFVVGLPIFLMSALLYPNIPISEKLITSKIKDKTFWNTARFANSLVLNSILFIVWTALFFIFFKWCLAVVLMLFNSALPKFYHTYFEFSRLLFSDLRCVRNKQLVDNYNNLKTLVINHTK
ncbi:MAG: 1-acyl-sn-glycerol-3-phosphate acyltransferase [Bacteroidales bacterium]|jgi:1-acyl-sn-glycerol-3-phosphate acyltransferase